MMIRITGKNKAFTLIEIMLVVAIIGILIAVAVPGFLRAREQSRQNVCQQNLIQIDRAIQQYIIEENLEADVVLGFGVDFLVGEENYLRTLPVCPSSGTYVLTFANDTPPVTCTVGTNSIFPHVAPGFEGGGT